MHKVVTVSLCIFYSRTGLSQIGIYSSVRVLNAEEEGNMYRQLFTVAVITAVLATPGCMSMGNESVKDETSESLSQKIKKGETTKAQVRTLFGEPSTVTSLPGGKEQWGYIFNQHKANPLDLVPVVGALQSRHGSSTNVSVAITFGASGVVEEYSTSRTNL